MHLVYSSCDLELTDRLDVPYHFGGEYSNECAPGFVEIVVYNKVGVSSIISAASVISAVSVNSAGPA